MARTASLYPPSPRDVPADLVSPSARYRLQVVVVLLSLFLFFLLYLALVGGSAYLTYWSLTYPVVSKVQVALKFVLVVASALLFLFLLKGLFKRERADKSLRIEVKEDDQPVLFTFIRRLCEEIGAPFPHRIFLSPEVNAAVFYKSSLLSLVLPTPKNLLIGMGLVNVLNLSEFKAVLAHEFGHFSQSSMKLGTYVYGANRIITDMVYGRDFFDDLLAKLRSVDIRIAVFVWGFYALLWVLRKVLEGFFRAINFFNSALSRQMEFNADLVAVSVTGSDALIHGLARLGFANDALMQACHDLSAAADHQIYTCDLFYHQNHAASFLRQLRKDPHLGEPPRLPADPEQTVNVFEPGDDGIPLMWASHPSNHDREQNAKSHYIRSVIDNRSPWLLFNDPQKVREKVSRRFYRIVVKVRKDVVLADPETVQAFIDDEHAETTYDARYHGLYDGRYLEPGDVRDLAQLARQEPAKASALAHSHAQLYGDELKGWMEAYGERVQEYEVLSGLEQGELKLKGKDFEFRGRRRTAAEVKKLLKKVDRELEDDRKKLAVLDRRVFLVHYRMGQQLGERVARELTDRYQFHLGVQAIVRNLSVQQARVEKLLEMLAGQGQLEAGDFAGALEIFREAHGVLSQGLRDARDLLLPDLKNMKAGEPLNRFLLEKRLIYELQSDEESVNGEWVGKFLQQLTEVRDKARRIHFKSLGGILALQEKISQKWLAQLAAIPEVMPAEPDRAAEKKSKP